MPEPRTGETLTRPGRWKTMVELKTALTVRGRSWSDVCAWARTVRTARGTARWSASDLAAPNRVAIEEYLAAGCPVVAVSATGTTATVGGRMAASRVRGLAAANAARPTAASLLTEHGLKWAEVREWGRANGVTCDHTKPNRPSLRCVRAYLAAREPVAS